MPLLLSCSSSTEGVEGLYYCEGYGFASLEGDSIISLWNIVCLAEKSITRKEEFLFVEHNSTDLISCRQDPNRRHSMSISVFQDNLLKMTSTDSCFMKIYGESELVFHKMENVDTRLDWTHLRVTAVRNSVEVSNIISKESLNNKYDELISFSTDNKPKLTFTQQVWSVFEFEEHLYSKYLSHPDNYQIQLLNNDIVKKEATVNVPVCYLKEFYYLLSDTL